MCIVDEIIKGLKDDLEKSDNEIFLSEADLQFCFAQKAKEKGAENIVLEYPINTSELYKGNEDIKEAFNFCNKDINKDKTYIDVKFEYNNEVYFVELKYKTSELDCVTRHGHSDFKLFEQSACNLGLYAIYEDIERMENIIEAPCIVEKYKNKNKLHSYILAITNDYGYWKPHKKSSYISNVSLEDKTRTKQENIYPCCIFENFTIEKYVSLNRKLKEQCSRPICLKNTYEINWEKFIFVHNSEFKYLKINLSKD